MGNLATGWSVPNYCGRWATAAASLQLSLRSATLCVLFLVTEPQARSGGSLQLKVPGWGMQELRQGWQSHLGVTRWWRGWWGQHWCPQA